MEDDQRHFKVTMFFPLTDNEGNAFADDYLGLVARGNHAMY